MPEKDDIELLRRYADEGSEEAFGALVKRHVNLVYSAALRCVGSSHHAEEITQAVFIILAKKARRLRKGTILSGWLYQTARLTAANFLRTEIRRARREQEAYMQSFLNESEPDVWPQIAPLLDTAVGVLSEKDRNAIVLRFFEGKSLNEVAVTLGASEEAAKMRVNRALEKMRQFFTKRGIALSATVICGAISANSVQAAPAGLAISAVAAAKGSAAAASTLTLVKGALELMAWAKAKTAAVVTAAAILTIGTTSVLVQKFVGEPSYGGRTVTEWLDELELYDLEERPDGTYTVYRSSESITNNPALHALLKIGSRGVPVLVERIQDRAEWPRDVDRVTRAKRRLEWEWARLRGSQSRIPYGWFPNYPLFQRKRKEAAGLVLIALGRNANGGFTRYMEAYAFAPKHESIYGTKIAGPPVGPTTSMVVKTAKSCLPHRQEEFFEDIMQGFQHTNAWCRSVAIQGARSLLDRFAEWKPRLVELAHDEDPLVQETALGTMIPLVWPVNASALEVMPPSEIRQVCDAIMANPRTTERVRDLAKTVRGLFGEKREQEFAAPQPANHAK